jgi:subtilisin-like proprotein convertase family protein
MRSSSFLKSLALAFTLTVVSSISFGQTTFTGTGVGAVPDGGAAGCGDFSAAPLNVSFAVSGITSALSDVKVSFTMSPAHTWVGDLRVILKAPANAASHTILSRTNQTTAAACGTAAGGGASDVAGPYTFSDTAPAAPTWWAAAVTAGGAGTIASGSYRTSVAGGGTANQGTETVMTAVFSGLSPAQINGNWTLEFSDGGGGDTGSVSAASLILTAAAAAPVQRVVDFNGDGKTDFSVVRNVGGQVNWFTRMNGSAATQGAAWGLPTDNFVSGDFDGDTKSDVVVWRAGVQGFFYILRSSTFTVDTQAFGQTGDDPSVVADYDGDGKTDVAVYRAGATVGAQSFWYYRGSLANPSGNITYTPWGSNGDFPAPGDYDGNGKADFCVQRAGTPNAIFHTRLSTGVVLAPVPFGLGSDPIVPGDYDGDGKTDIATSRTITGVINWFWLPSSGGPFQTRLWGATGDLRTQGDYDGDGKTDVAVWRPNVGFYANQSSNGSSLFQAWGAAGDYAIANFNTH